VRRRTTSNLAISHLEHVARWDRDERGETPTDALRDFVTDGGVDQSDGETDPLGRDPKIRKPPIRSFESTGETIFLTAFSTMKRRMSDPEMPLRPTAASIATSSTPSDDADLPRTNAGTQLPEIRFVDRFERRRRAGRRHRRERRAAVPRHRRHDDRPRLLAYDGRSSTQATAARVSRRPRTTSATRRSTCITMGGRKASFRADPDSRRAGDHAGGGQPCLNRRRVRPACSTSTASRRVSGDATPPVRDGRGRRTTRRRFVFATTALPRTRW